MRDRYTKFLRFAQGRANRLVRSHIQLDPQQQEQLALEILARLHNFFNANKRWMPERRLMEVIERQVKWAIQDYLREQHRADKLRKRLEMADKHTYWADPNLEAKDFFQSLPQEDRHILLLSALGNSQQDIASKLNLPIRTLQRRLSDLRGEINELLR